MSKAETIILGLGIIVFLFGFLWRSYAPASRSSRGDALAYGGDGSGESAGSSASYDTGDCGPGGDAGGCGDGGGGDGGD